MLILILETSTEKACLALARKGEALSSKPLSGGPELSKTLALEVQKLLGDAVPDLIAVGTGPGSYTGIRVGVALARALAYGWNIPCLGFCSLKAFGRPPVCVDARQGGIYTFLDEKPLLLRPEELADLPLIGSPHPDKIRSRVNGKGIFESREPDLTHLAPLIREQFLKEGAPHFALDYLST